MVEQSGRASKTPSPSDIEGLCKSSMEIAESVDSEKEWYEQIKQKALNWLVAQVFRLRLYKSGVFFHFIIRA